MRKEALSIRARNWCGCSDFPPCPGAEPIWIPCPLENVIRKSIRTRRHPPPANGHASCMDQKAGKGSANAKRDLSSLWQFSPSAANGERPFQGVRCGGTSVRGHIARTDLDLPHVQHVLGRPRRIDRQGACLSSRIAGTLRCVSYLRARVQARPDDRFAEFITHRRM